MIQKIFFLSCLVTATFVKFANAQNLVITVSLGSCIKCEQPLSSMSPYKTNVPAFIVFPTILKPEIAEIDEAHEFTKKGYNILFSDKLYKKHNLHKEGTVSIISPTGNLIFNTSILTSDERVISADLKR